MQQFTCLFYTMIIPLVQLYTVHAETPDGNCLTAQAEFW